MTYRYFQTVKRKKLIYYSFKKNFTLKKKCVSWEIESHIICLLTKAFIFQMHIDMIFILVQAFGIMGGGAALKRKDGENEKWIQ